jgi:hypothetical protein
MKAKLTAILLISAMILSVTIGAGANTPFGKGDVTGTGDVTINDALEILKFLAKLPNEITVAGRGSPAWEAATITGGSADPTISDALEVLKKLAKLPNLIDSPVNTPNTTANTTIPSTTTGTVTTATGGTTATGTAETTAPETTATPVTTSAEPPVIEYTNMFGANEMELRAAVAGAGTTPTAIHLTADVELLSNFVIPANANIKLTSDGTAYKLIATRNMDVVEVAAGATLTLEHITITQREGTDGSGVSTRGTFIMTSGTIIGIRGGEGLDDGGGIAVTSTGTNSSFTMHGGTIIDCGLAFMGVNFTMHGGLITENRFGGISSTGTVTMHGGTISNNGGNRNASAGGVAARVFVMHGGEIIDNTATRGGGVIISGNADITINGGKISGNTSTSTAGGYNGGGGIFGGTGTLILNGGEISGNTSAADGGGIAAINVTLNGGVIHDNTAARNGGGMYAQGNVQINRGTISGNTAQNGGGIYFNIFNRTLRMTGGIITDNTAEAGGGVAVERGIFTFDGGWIHDNTADSDVNVHLGANVTFNNNVFDPTLRGIGSAPPQ